MNALIRQITLQITFSALQIPSAKSNLVRNNKLLLPQFSSRILQNIYPPKGAKGSPLSEMSVL